VIGQAQLIRPFHEINQNPSSNRFPHAKSGGGTGRPEQKANQTNRHERMVFWGFIL